MAQRTISISGGDFGSASTWVEGIVPTSSDFILGTTASGDLTISSGNRTAQYINFTDYTGTLIFTSNTISGGFLTIGLSGGTSTFGASMSFSYVSLSIFAQIRIGVNHTIVQNTSSRIPCLYLTGGSTITITLSTNLLLNSLIHSSTTSPNFNGNTFFINDRCIMSATGRIAGTSNMTFDGPVIFNRNPRATLSNTIWSIDTNSFVFYQPTLTTANTYVSNADAGISLTRDFRILQGTISMTASTFPFLVIPNNTTSITINTNTEYNFTKTSTNATYITTLNASNIGELIYNTTSSPSSINNPTASAPFVINSLKDLTIKRLRTHTGLYSFNSSGTNAIGNPLELQLGGTYSYTIGDIISIGGGDYFVNQNGAWIDDGGSLITFGPSWVQYNMIRSSVAGTKVKLNLTSGTSSAIAWTNFIDIDASGGNTIKTFNPIQGSQVSNCDNIEVITSFGEGGGGGGETSYTFVN